jgi:hypothetical protein
MELPAASPSNSTAMYLLIMPFKFKRIEAHDYPVVMLCHKIYSECMTVENFTTEGGEK